MHRYAQRWTLRRTAFLMAAIVGAFVAAYGVYGWSQFGFDLGPIRENPTATAGYGYFVMCGGAIIAYSLFELRRPTQDNSDDG
jgi:hypothetical protein